VLDLSFLDFQFLTGLNKFADDDGIDDGIAVLNAFNAPE